MHELELSVYPWQSTSVYVAMLDGDGVVLSANPALIDGAGDELVIDTEFAELIVAEQRDAFSSWLAGAGEAWDSAIFGFHDGGGGPAHDRQLWIRRDATDTFQLIAEPAWQDQTRLVEQVLQLNDDLIETQRNLNRRQRQLEQAQAEAHGAVLRVNELESVLLATLAHTDSDRGMQDLLDTAQQLLPGDRADLLLVDETLDALTLRASSGSLTLISPRPQIPLGVGILGTIALTGESQLIDDLSDAVRRVGARGSLIAVPLRVDGRIAGVLAVRAEQPSSFQPSHLRLLEVVAERVALAVGHAQLREREQRMAQILQRTLLPQRLPAVPGFELSAQYQGRAATVGGDFYDAIALPDGRLAVAVGDVSGKGLRAAAAMAHLRTGIHALAIDCTEPAEVLRRLGRMAETDGLFATAVVLLIDPADGSTIVANAGHPPPLLVDPGGAEFLEPDGARSALLGLSVARRGQAQIGFPPGTTIVLYTDGLIESTRDLDGGMARLRSEAAACGDCSSEELCEHLLAALSPTGRYRDDVTLLAVRRV